MCLFGTVRKRNFCRTLCMISVNTNTYSSLTWSKCWFALCLATKFCHSTHICISRKPRTSYEYRIKLMRDFLGPTKITKIQRLDWHLENKQTFISMYSRKIRTHQTCLGPALTVWPDWAIFERSWCNGFYQKLPNCMVKFVVKWRATLFMLNYSGLPFWQLLENLGYFLI